MSAQGGIGTGYWSPTGAYECGVLLMKMTRARLEEYRRNKDVIRELQYKLDHLGEGDSLIGYYRIRKYGNLSEFGV